MREVKAEDISKAVARLCREANYNLGEDVISIVKSALEAEQSETGKNILKQILENARIAAEEETPLCQDCGTAVVFLEIGQDVHITGGLLTGAVQEGVRSGYRDAYLRKSIVRQPYSARVNTGDNTPAVIHTEIIEGDKIKIIVMPKGGGAENMSRLFMLNPSDGKPGIVSKVVQAVSEAGANPCPPVIIGLGIAATSDRAMLLAKKALLREAGKPALDMDSASLEKEILDKVNKLGIGPMGFGGRITALAVHAEVEPVHLASLPVAVNMQCHSCRHKEVIL